MVEACGREDCVPYLGGVCEGSLSLPGCGPEVQTQNPGTPVLNTPASIPGGTEPMPEPGAHPQ